MKLVKKSSLALLAAIALSSVSSASVHAAEAPKNYTSNASVEFVADNHPTDPVDPDNPGENVKPWDPTTPDHRPQPGTDGPLSIDFASSLEFGKNVVSVDDVTYYADPQYLFNADGSDKDDTTARPNYVQVTDKRGTNDGWNLTVKQEAQLTAQKKDAVNRTLKGAEIKLTSPVAVSKQENATAPSVKDITLKPGQASQVMGAKKGSGFGTWIDKFGTVEDTEIMNEKGEKVTAKKNKAITLYVPGASAKDADEYRSVLTWTLAAQPGNIGD